MNSKDENRLFAAGSDSDDPEGGPPVKSTSGDTRDERGYTRFDEQDDDYEEPDRDTDCATIYTEDDEEYYLDDPEPVAADIFSERSPGARDPDPEPDDDWAEDDEDEWDREERWDDELQEDTAGERDNDRDPEDDSLPGTRHPAASLPPRREMMDADLDWQEEDGYPDEAAVEDNGVWPLSLIAVAVVAVLLLAAGGYGVLQQRAAMQEEIRQLQADLATAVTPDQAAASREAARDLEQRNGELEARLDALILENRRLEETIAGLETRLEEQPAAAQQPAAPASTAPATVSGAPAPAVKAAPARTTPAQEKPAAATSATADAGWFVNFGSYSQQAMAESWAARLTPPAGKVVVTTGSKGGELFYRVRVIDLASREQAERTARKLEGDHGLSRLWVGSE
mgnify:CR=1 FL=1